MKTELNPKLISHNILALYPGGEFSTTENLKPNWILLIDLTRLRYTITTNSKTTHAREFCGLLWHNTIVDNTGEYLVIDDDFIPFQRTSVNEDDFKELLAGSIYGILQLETRTYMNQNGDCKIIRS